MKSDGIVAILVTLDVKKSKMVVPPSVYARGFSAAEDTHVVRHSQMRANDAYVKLLASRASLSEMKHTIKKEIAAYIERKTGRHPIILPIILETR